MTKFSEVKEKFIQYMTIGEAPSRSIESVRNGVHIPADLVGYIMQIRECNLKHLKQMQLSGDEESDLFMEDLRTMFSELDDFMQQTIACMHESMLGIVVSGI